MQKPPLIIAGDLTADLVAKFNQLSGQLAPNPFTIKSAVLDGTQSHDLTLLAATGQYVLINQIRIMTWSFETDPFPTAPTLKLGTNMAADNLLPTTSLVAQNLHLTELVPTTRLLNMATVPLKLAATAGTYGNFYYQVWVTGALLGTGNP